MTGCVDNPIVEGLMKKISREVNISTDNFESFQVLRYAIGQKYDLHHDASMNDFQMVGRIKKRTNNFKITITN